MQKTAIYPGTFDPITLGHVDLARRAAKLFDKLIIAVAASNKKSPLFSLAERLQIIRDVFKNTPNIEVCSFDNLLVNLAKEKQAQVIVRGLRSATDVEFEFQLASMNRILDKNLETIFLMPADQYTYISSTIVREIAQMQGDMSAFVPPEVITAFKKSRT